MIEGAERRKGIEELLSTTRTPVSGAELARTFGVSRQVIVQDIALLRAKNRNIISTNKGYLLFDSIFDDNTAKTAVAVKHTSEQVFDELSTIVELGGKVLDVSVDHDFYGQIQADLVINDLEDAKEFVRRMNESNSKPLKVLTGDIHYHTISAPSEKILEIIKQHLKDKGYLV